MLLKYHPKILPALFCFVEVISLGLPEKSVTWLPEVISWEKISMGLPDSLAGSQRSVRRCETGSTCNAVTGIYLGELIWSKSPERSVIGNL